MKKAVVVLRTKPDKSSIKTSLIQADHIKNLCFEYGIQVVDYIVVFSGIKEIYKGLKEVDARGRFDIVAIYAPMQITKTPQEYKEFVATVKDDFQAEVLYARSRV